MNGPSAGFVYWSRLLIQWVLVALVVVLMIVAYGRAANAEAEVQRVRAGANARINGLLVEQSRLAEQNAQLRERVARFEATTTTARRR